MLLFLHRDKAVQSFFFAGRYPALDDVQAVYAKLLEPPPDGDAWTTDSLQRALERPRAKVRVATTLLRRQRVVTQQRDGALALRPEQLDDATIESLIGGYRDKREHDRELLEQMVFYGQTGQCRWQVLLKHFDDESDFDRCGHCDNCRRIASVERNVAAGSDDARPADPLHVAPPPSPIAPPAFRPGEPVRVPRYGGGLVKSADATRVTVEFPNGATRCFLASFVRPQARRGPARSRAGERGRTLEAA